MRKKNIIRIAIATGLILLVPFILTVNSGITGWNWAIEDFIAMGVLLFGAGLCYEFLGSRIQRKPYKLLAAFLVAFVTFLIWAELAVGLVSKLISPSFYKSNNHLVVHDPKNATYTINGQSITLVNGVSEMEQAPGSASKIITRYFGNEVQHDLNDDGKEDVAFIITQQTGGSGTAYYVVAALDSISGYVGSDAFFLGDRIAPQSTTIDEGATSNGTKRNNVIVVNYAVRAPGEPMTAAPSLGKSIWLKLDPGTMQLGEVAQNFEGESH